MNTKAYKEELLRQSSLFPVEIFISDNLIETVQVNSHWHECIEILFILEGTAEQQVKDRYFHVVKHFVFI